MPAFRAFLTGIARIDVVDRHACKTRLVLYEGPKLTKRPTTVQSSALLPPSPRPRADTLEVFEGYRPLRALGKLDDAFADLVVSIRGEAALSAGQLLQTAPFRLGASALQLSPESSSSSAYTVDRRARMDVPVRVGCNVPDPEVHPECSFGNKRLRGVDLTGSEQVPLALPVDKIALAFTIL